MEEKIKQIGELIESAKNGNNPFFFTTKIKGDTNLIRDVAETTLKEVKNILIK